MKIRDIILEADPKDLGNMNDKMRDVLSKVDADDKAQAQAAKDRAEAERQAKAKELGPQAMDDYIAKLKAHDWTYDYSDDHRVWQRGSQERDEIRRLAKIIDPDLKIYNKFNPMKSEGVEESATAGATSAGNIASVEAPHLSPGNARGKKSYIGDPMGGRSGTKAPPQPKVKQPKKKDGTAKNALDMKNSIFGENPIRR